jgi:hypothetical protein
MALVDFTLDDVGGVFTSLREAITGEKIKDPVEMAKADLMLKQLENAAKTGQLKVNEVEAAHPSIFVAGWRPAIGWVSAVSLALMYIPKALVMTYVWAKQCAAVLAAAELANDFTDIVIPAFPDLGAMDIIGLVGSMLGIATLRSFDKHKGSDTKVIK